MTRISPLTLLALPLLATTALSQAATPTPIGRLPAGDGGEITIEGVVTARTADGVFVQDRGDGDPATPDAIRVRFDALPAVGERVRVEGRFAGDGRSLQATAITPLGRTALPKAIVLRQAPADWAPYAGMRVKIAAPLTVAGTDRVEKHGELTLNFGDRLRTPSDAARPGDGLRAVAADNARRTLWLDDGSDAE
ncbi:MAG: ExeM/NucH family extracellular endonuclease, partial [Lysobacteraceae bacterium]